MKYLFSITYYSPYISGVSIYVKRLAEQLSKRGHNCSVICLKHDSALPTRETVYGVFVHRSTPLLTLHKGFLSIKWVWDSLVASIHADVVCVNLPQPEGIFPAMWGRLLGKKVVSIYHCDVCLPQGLLNTLAQWVVDITSLVVLSLSTTITTYTMDYARASRILSRFVKKVQVVYPPVPDLPDLKNERNSVLKRINEKSSFTIGIAARLASEKGVEYLLEAVKDFSCQIVIAGPLNPVGEEKYKIKITNLVKSMGEKVVFLGPLNPESMGTFYPLLDVLVLPSINFTEAFGIVQVEAMRAGIPVIATDLPGVRIPIQKTGMGIVVQIKNPQALKNALIEIRDNPQKYHVAKSKIEKEFNLEDTLRFYEQL